MTIHRFSVMHDASHSALSTRRWINVLGGYWGVAWTSPHEWELQHVLGHHLQPNVLGEDPDVVHVARASRPNCMTWGEKIPQDFWRVGETVSGALDTGECSGEPQDTRDSFELSMWSKSDILETIF